MPSAHAPAAAAASDQDAIPELCRLEPLLSKARLRRLASSHTRCERGCSCVGARCVMAGSSLLHAVSTRFGALPCRQGLLGRAADAGCACREALTPGTLSQLERLAAAEDTDLALLCDALHALLRSWQASDAGAPPAVAGATLPAEDTFCVSSGEAASPTPAQLPAAQAYWASWQQRMSTAASLLRAAPAAGLAAAWPTVRAAQARAQPEGLPGGVRIQELPALAPEARSPQIPVAALLLVCSLHAAGDQLPAPWSTLQPAAAAGQLVEALAAAQAGTCPGRQLQAAHQQLLSTAFPAACDHFRAYLLCQPQTEAARLQPYAGKWPLAALRAACSAIAARAPSGTETIPAQRAGQAKLSLP